MAHIVIIGAGLGGLPMAYEMQALARAEDRVTVVANTTRFHFTPSNPWVAVKWRQREDIELEIAPLLEKKGIGFIAQAVTRVMPETKQLTLADGATLDYDMLVIATGPQLAFDEIPGFGPEGHTQSICHVEHAADAQDAWDAFVANPGPIVVGAVQGASCFGPAYEYARIMETDLRKRKLRDRVPMTFVTAEPYIGHMGLGGVGDSKSLLESELRQRHIKWITNARVTAVEKGKLKVDEVDGKGALAQSHEVAFDYAMLLPAFTGVDAVRGVEGLTNPRGFILIDEHQRNPTFRNIFSAGVCVAIPPVEATPVPTGAPKTGFMIESMVTAIAHNLRDALAGREGKARATWNAVCLADMGDTGAAFVALPQIPPRNVTWAKVGKWVHLAKVAFEKYYLRKMRTGNTDPVYEKYVLKALGIERLKS